MQGATLDDIAWHTLTLKHTSAIRSWLMPANTVLDKERQEYDMDLMATEQYQKAIRICSLPATTASPSAPAMPLFSP